MLEERIDLNHVTIIFDNELNRIKIECHFKKYSKVIELKAENETSFNIWKQYIQFELQFNDPNQNKENANHHVSHVTDSLVLNLQCPSREIKGNFSLEGHCSLIRKGPTKYGPNSKCIFRSLVINVLEQNSVIKTVTVDRREILLDTFSRRFAERDRNRKLYKLNFYTILWFLIQHVHQQLVFLDFDFFIEWQGIFKIHDRGSANRFINKYTVRGCLSIRQIRVLLLDNNLH